MTTNAIDLNAPDIATTASGVFVTYEPPKPRPKVPAILRESDGRHQLVGYLGWKTILHRLALRRP